MLLSQIIKNVDSLNSLNEKVGSSAVWSYDNDVENYYFRIFRIDCGLDAFISAFDIECLLGNLNIPFLVGVEDIDGVRRIVLSFNKIFITYD